VVAYWVCPDSNTVFEPRCVRLWAGSDRGLADMPTIELRCRQLTQEAHDKRWRPQTKKPSRMLRDLGRVYFVAGADLIKIGFTLDVPGRFDRLCGSSPVPLTLLGVMRGTPATERELHAKFAAQRAHGEWFRPSLQLSAFIAANAPGTSVGTPARIRRNSRNAEAVARQPENREELYV